MKSPSSTRSPAPTWERLAPAALGLLALFPLVWQRAAFAELFWFGDEWDLLSQIERLGFWPWTWQVFAENFVPVFKLLWGGSVLLFGGSYFALVVLMWLTHAVNTWLLGRVLRLHDFPGPAVWFAQIVFGLTAINLETLGWTVQWSAVLATTFLLLALERQARHPSHFAAARARDHAGLMLLAAGSALSFSRGVLTGAVLGLGALLAPAEGETPNWRRRWCACALCLLPALATALVILLFASGNHRHLGGHVGDAASYGLWYFALNPFHRLLAVDSWGWQTLTLLGLGKLALVTGVLAQTRGRPRHLLLLLLAYDLGNSALLGLGRYHTGLETAISSRYQYGALLAVLPFACLAVDACLRRLPPALRRWHVVTTLILLGTGLFVVRPWSWDAPAFAHGRGTVTRHLLLQDPHPPALGALPGIDFMSTERAKRLIQKYRLAPGAATTGTGPTVLEGGFGASDGRFDPAGFARLHGSVPLWDSWQGDDKLTGRLRLGPFKLGEDFSLYISGYIDEHGEILGWENVADGRRQLLAPRTTPTERWALFRWSVPQDWRGQSVYFFAEDRRSDGNGWLGVSAPVEPGFRLAPIFSVICWHGLAFVALLLPGAATVVWVARRHPLPAELVLTLTLVVSATVAYALFFLTFASARAGAVVASIILLGSMTAFVVGWPGSRATIPWRELSRPLLVTLTAGLLYTAVLFLYGGIEQPVIAAMDRFLWRLPPDCTLPYWITVNFAEGEPLRAFLGTWLTSDRPPLQSAFGLALYPIASPALAQQIMGTILQTWVILGLWVLLRRARVPARTGAWVLFFVVFAGFFLLNGAFVWPKLLPTAFLLLASALLFFGQERMGGLAGACAGLAMLGHGASAFGVIGLGLVSLLRPPPKKWRYWGMAGLVGVLYLAPWTFYQKFGDPPGNRLLKWHLAGVAEIDGRSFGQTLKDSFGALSARDFLQARWANFSRLFHDPNVTSSLAGAFRTIRKGQAAAGLRTAAYDLRAGSFLNLFQAPGLLGLAGIGLLSLARRRGRRPEEFRLAAVMLALVIATTVAWCLLMFLGASTVNHQGSYFNNACLFVALGIGACQLPRGARWGLAVLTLLWFASVWVFSPDRDYHTAALLPSAEPAQFGLVIFTCAASLCSLIWLGRANPDRSP